ncbi:MAG: protein kinase [Deltaproteobacteria bacterium]|nr:protein kinase [Deltaproteobacteria bacterium]MDQ3300501.1 protein kinase [Myxococcota bacterium]
MSIGGDDDTIAGTEPGVGGAATPEIAELVAKRYRIVRWLGGGGMGSVYEALDTELGDPVALKVLRGGLSDDALERFRREVRLTRRVQHRNVARMFDIGEHAGDRFLTMELIAGEPLTRELGSRMPWPRLLSIAIQICEGLEAAHRVGVIHRDLKPDNVLLERATDRAVITDFGIARSMDDVGVTQVGAVIGTPRYMSPEQLAGSTIDARADLFSLGVMLFELASGQRPWSGDNAISIAVAQATQPARTLATSALPAGFRALVARCLAIDPAERPASVGELLAVLRSPEAMAGDGEAANVTAAATTGRSRVPTLSRATATPTGQMTFDTRPAESSIAVLPFACAAGDEYLADGVGEDVIDTLSTGSSLRVRPAGIGRARGDADPRALGRELEVDHVVVGSLRRTPAGLRVSARLISVADGFQIWAHRADGAEAEILAISELLGREIATALSTRATAAPRPTDPRSVDLYLRARGELRRFWGSHAESAANLLEEAYALSPTSAPIAGARAFATVQMWVMQAEPALYERAERALADGLASGHPEAILASGSFKLNTGDPIGAASDFATALLRAPMLAQAHESAAKVLVEIHAMAEARHHFETAGALDPNRTAVISTELARLDALEGWWDRADRRLVTLMADPDRSLVQLGAVFKARLAGWRGDRAAMLATSKLFAARMGDSANKLVHYVSDATQSGSINEDTVRDFLTTFSGKKPRRGQIMGVQLLCEMGIVLGFHDVALVALEKADVLGFMDIVILERCPLFDKLRDEPRFETVRLSVAARAASVLAAFRAATG